MEFIRFDLEHFKKKPEHFADLEAAARELKDKAKHVHFSLPPELFEVMLDEVKLYPPAWSFETWQQACRKGEFEVWRGDGSSIGVTRTESKEWFAERARLREERIRQREAAQQAAQPTAPAAPEGA